MTGCDGPSSFFPCLDGFADCCTQVSSLAAVGMDPGAFLPANLDGGKRRAVAVTRHAKIADNIVYVRVMLLDIGFQDDIQPRSIYREFESNGVGDGAHVLGI